MQSKELVDRLQESAKAPSLDEDIKSVNALKPVSVCIWVRTKGAPPGTRTVKPETLREQLGLDSNQTDSMDRMFDYCLGLIARYHRTPASLVGELIQRGLERERSVFLVDAVSALAQYVRQSTQIENSLLAPDIIQRLERLEAALQSGSSSEKRDRNT